MGDNRQHEKCRGTPGLDHDVVSLSNSLFLSFYISILYQFSNLNN
ncbi:hypothetical protein AGR7C_Cc150018 [Agrobacterium deltaense Zutra 3/1]|uniref:Uncharacterized protein n=1 Tax=Agrobacterium deltaense Zutra 3/1 TaxID=1183427 RepID=A0A1S7PDB7_9HYPH|nr:hypothetical protein AGR7C_Cc150018 [Agrobacterium deltaense Zutra 3/1]